MAALRFLRLALLVGSVLLTPQLWLAHALSHGLAAPASPAQPADPAGKERQSQSDKVCDACLAFAQLDAAVPAHFDWTACADAAPLAAPLPAGAWDGATPIATRARGPPTPRA
ncbi:MULTISPECIES: hypothetical protein [unclassified Rhizobacter]|uniref:hypothetical protein n=1 Tax=unclassified Rhizobacter TaxID=2640088 RepID=UPI0006F7B26E|nr:MULTISPECIES: hypothetical protein [unclassified Rhizobacter]KQU81564.1 hypothetical protein ASC88_01420 [Rhizobacter sp. Root29]KQW12105.1 hypothetical protein ASC98_20150 [Rhizobacter sp. Root1238]KRB02920.1 hypothetical protein ASE08_15235 [Rhizobacter sp. Root16D2]